MTLPMSTDQTRARLSPSAYAVLGLLAQQPSAGYELGARAATSIAHFWPLTRTHIYTELERLKGSGLRDRDEGCPAAVTRQARVHVAQHDAVLVAGAERDREA